MSVPFPYHEIVQKEGYHKPGYQNIHGHWLVYFSIWDNWSPCIFHHLALNTCMPSLIYEENIGYKFVLTYSHPLSRLYLGPVSTHLGGSESGSNVLHVGRHDFSMPIHHSDANSSLSFNHLISPHPPTPVPAPDTRK